MRKSISFRAWVTMEIGILGLDPRGYECVMVKYVMDSISVC